MGREAKPSFDQSHLVQLITQCHHPSSTTGAYSFRMNIANIAEQLAETGYNVLEKPLLANLSTRLLSRCQDDDPARVMAARIDRGRAKQQNNSIRGDVIS